MEDTVKKSSPPYGIIAILMIGAFVGFLNNTLLNVALPSIMVDLHVNTSTVQWSTTGYMLVNGILIPTTAFLIEKYSVRRLFLVAISLFTIGTIVAGYAPVFSVLLAGRMLQASGSAIMMPLLMNVMLVSFPVERRGAAMGVFGLILMFAPAIGPTLSGWIVEHYDWRMLFHFIAPIAIACLIIGFFLLKDKKKTVPIHLDIFSVILSSIGFGGILYGFSSAGNKGWSSPQVYITIIIGVLSLAFFIVRQQRQERPLLSFNVFKYPMYSLGVAITMVVNMAMFSGILLLPIYTQTVRGFTPMQAGLMMLPGAIVNAAMSPVNGRLFDKFGGRILAATGLCITTITTYMLSQLTFETTYYHLMLIHAVRMFGMSMVMMPVQTNGLNQLPRKYYPHGTAMNNTLNQVSGAIGTSLLTTVMSIKQEHVAENLAVEYGIKGLTGAKLAAVKQQIALEAMLKGINFTFFVSTILVFIAFALALFMKRSTPMEEVKVVGSTR